MPNCQVGYTSLAHPWGGGVTKWLSEEILGIKPTAPVKVFADLSGGTYAVYACSQSVRIRVN